METKYPSKRVLVTGGAGFIGSHLTDLLLQEGHFVTVVDNLSNGRLNNLKNATAHDRFKFINADIRRTADLKGVFGQIDWVFHLAGLACITPSINNPRSYFETNVDGTYNVLEASVEAGVKRFLYAASSSCYGIPNEYPTPETAPVNPQTPYALTKHLGEQLVLHWAQCYQLPALSLRLFNVFGPRLCVAGSDAAVLGIFLQHKLTKKPLPIIGDGKQTRDFIYIADVIEAFYAAAKSDLSNDFMNVGSASCHSINYLADLFGGPVTYVSKRPKEADHSLANVDKIYQKLFWKAKVSFEEGVGLLLESIQDVHSLPIQEQLCIR